MNLSVLVPVFNEEENIPELTERLLAVMKSQKKSFEIIFIDDGSNDRSAEIIKGALKVNPEIKLVRFNRNYGQHSALFAGFSLAQGKILVTIDADLQNPPEEIPKLLQKMAEGYEVVGGCRLHRKDSVFRKIPTYLVAKMASRFVQVPLKDYGCMLRAYRSEVIKEMLASGETSTYIPALANSLATSVAEVPVLHRARSRGKSKYSLLGLLHLNFDLMTSFSLIPIQLIGIAGGLISFLGLGFSAFLLIMRLLKGSEWAAQGVFTLFGILFFFVGLQFLALGILGEYVGRNYQETRNRPRYRIREIVTSRAIK